MEFRAKKIAIAVVSILLVAALIFGMLLFSGVFGEDVVDKIYSNTGSEIKADITFDNDKPVYDGKGDFNAMDGVKAVDKDGNDITDMVTYSFTSGSTNNEKTINYSINSKDYSFAVAKRTLVLENYSMPSITVNTDSISTDISQINTMLAQAETNKNISAEDGFGNDISSSISCSDLNKIIAAGTYSITLNVQNMFGDNAQAQCSVTVTGKALDTTAVVLKSDSAIIYRGEFLDPYSYVESAIDKDGNDVSEKV